MTLPTNKDIEDELNAELYKILPLLHGRVIVYNKLVALISKQREQAQQELIQDLKVAVDVAANTDETHDLVWDFIEERSTTPSPKETGEK